MLRRLDILFARLFQDIFFFFLQSYLLWLITFSYWFGSYAFYSYSCCNNLSSIKTCLFYCFENTCAIIFWPVKYMCLNVLLYSSFPPPNACSPIEVIVLAVGSLENSLLAHMYSFLFCQKNASSNTIFTKSFYLMNPPETVYKICLNFCFNEI